MSSTPPEPSPIPNPVPPGPENPPGPLEAPPPVEEPPPTDPPDEAPHPTPDENDNPPRQKLHPPLVLSGGEDVLTITHFDELRRFPLPDIEGAGALREMIDAASNETEIILAATAFATWAKGHGLLLD